MGASGQTGRFVLRYLCAASVPVIASVRRTDRLAPEPSLASAEVVVANVEQPNTLAPLLERAAHVIYLAGGNRKRLSPGAWQVEVDGLADCLELARRAGLPGRWISVGYSGSDEGIGLTWAETRWRELKLAAEEVISASGVNYFLLRTGLI
ncbi:MAG: SDR family oxidoreductase, partial [Burkholderiaceae bacterium]